MRIIQHSRTVFNSTLEIFYPNDCQICQTKLNWAENYVCINCSYDLPYIQKEGDDLLKLQQLFWGRVNIENIYSLFQYHRGNQVQTLLHQLKYKGKIKLGNHYGEILGKNIKKEQGIDMLIPIPLHRKKMHQRGYNQSMAIASGIQKALDIPLLNGCIKRVAHNKSQTKFSKYDRWENVRSIFEVAKPDKIKNKHVLLIDDVLTTGATIEACAIKLLEVEGCKVSVATLAARI